MYIIEARRPPLRDSRHPLAERLIQRNYITESTTRITPAPFTPDRDDLKVLKRPRTVIVHVQRLIRQLGRHSSHHQAQNKGQKYSHYIITKDLIYLFPWLRRPINYLCPLETKNQES